MRQPRGAALFLAALVVSGGCDGDPLPTSSGPTTTAAERLEADAGAAEELPRFNERMRLVFTGIVADQATFGARAAAVEAGERPEPGLAAELDASLRRATGTRDLLGSSAGLAGRPVVKEIYLRSAQLYVEAVRMLRAAVGAEQARRSGLVEQARRLVALSNHVYDRSSALVEAEVAARLPPSECDPGADIERTGPGYELACLARAIGSEAARASALGAGPSARHLTLIAEDLRDLAGGLLPDPARLPPQPRSGFDRSELDPRATTGLTGG